MVLYFLLCMKRMSKISDNKIKLPKPISHLIFKIVSLMNYYSIPTNKKIVNDTPEQIENNFPKQSESVVSNSDTCISQTITLSSEKQEKSCILC